MFSSNSSVRAMCVLTLRTKKVVTGRRRRRLVKLPATSTLCVRNSIKRFNDFLIFIENSASMCGPNATVRRRKKAVWEWFMADQGGGVCEGPSHSNKNVKLIAFYRCRPIVVVGFGMVSCKCISRALGRNGNSMFLTPRCDIDE